MEKISFVVPAYNEELNIPILYEKIVDEMQKFHQNWEIIFINDGSKDKTLEILKDFSKKDQRIKWIDLSRNFGHQSALTAGLDAATGDAIISMDCDLQDPPEVIGQMIEQWRKGYKIVYARRKNRQDNFLKKYTAIWYYKILYRFSDIQIPRNVADFRLVDREVLEILKNMKEKARYLRGMVAWTGFSHTFVDFERPERLYGISGYSWKKSWHLAMDGIMNFSMLPVKMAFWLGIILNSSAVLIAFYMIFNTLFTEKAYLLSQWALLLVLFGVGIQFFMFWFLGEYISRIYDQSKDRPLYIVKNKNFE